MAEATLKSYEPTWRDHIARLLMGDEKASPEKSRLISGLLGSTGLGNSGMSVADLTPLGGVLGLQESAHEGDKTGVALNAAGLMIPGAAPVAKALGLGEKEAAKVIRAYHGSPHDFDKFDMKFAGSTTDPGLLGKGLYFTDDATVAAPSAHRYEVGLNIKNPLNIEISADWGRKNKIISQELGIPNPTSRAELAEWSQKVADAVKARGHDSVALDYSPAGYKAKEYAVFDDSLIEILRKYGLAGLSLGGLGGLGGIADASQPAADPAL